MPVSGILLPYIPKYPKLDGVNLQAWLTHIIEAIGDCKQNQLDYMLPYVAVELEAGKLITTLAERSPTR